ncbi:MAG: 4-hydroxybenzoyl-CoA reductase subunit beta [Immundisolibacterales bacterium]|nr:4-hydroxybenzoyl-CoA reductase subunit beta [Immundisolibacterales bacterium]
MLPEWELLAPSSVDEVRAARAHHPGSRFLGGGTDLVVNLRRGIGDPPATLIDLNRVADLKGIEVAGEWIRIGAGVTIRELAQDPRVRASFPGLAAAAGSIAGPTHRNMGTVGGNLCLDTRCIYYNQSEWWRAANRYCLKYGGDICHVAPKSRICYATFSGDLAPALAVLDDAQIEIAGAQGARTLPLDSLYTGDGERYLALEPDELVVAVRARRPPALRTGYDKVRVRQSIDYPLAGVAAGVVREGDRLADLRLAFTGTNPRPLRLAGTEDLCGGALDDAVMERLSGLVRRQVMAMRTTFTSGHYRRHAAGVLARRLVRRLFDTT